jgi:hypothetical protein
MEQIVKRAELEERKKRIDYITRLATTGLGVTIGFLVDAWTANFVYCMQQDARETLSGRFWKKRTMTEKRKT